MVRRFFNQYDGSTCGSNHGLKYRSTCTINIDIANTTERILIFLIDSDKTVENV